MSKIRDMAIVMFAANSYVVSGQAISPEQMAVLRAAPPANPAVMDGYVRQATAALKAIIEPTEAQVTAMERKASDSWGASVDYRIETDTYTFQRNWLRELYREAIRAAIAEES